MREIISFTNNVLVKQKPLNATVEIANQYRNNSITYNFIMNFDTDMNVGDYVVFEWTGLWTLLTNATKLISGVSSSKDRTPVWTKNVDTAASKTTLTLGNFSKIYKSKQFTFFQPLVTPLAAATYTLSIKAYR